MNIGIVENEPNLVSTYFTYDLLEAGHQVTLHTSAQEAMSSVLNAQSNGQPSYDVMLVDLLLDSIDGAEFIARVREMLPNTPTRFILMTETFNGGYDALIKKHLLDVHLLPKEQRPGVAVTVEMTMENDEYSNPETVLIEKGRKMLKISQDIEARKKLAKQVIVEAEASTPPPALAAPAPAPTRPTHTSRVKMPPPRKAHSGTSA